MRFAFDSLCVRDSLLFGWGWLLHERLVATRIALVIRGADGTQSAMRCHQTGSRDDLVDAFPAIPHARGGGFLVQARVVSDLNACAAWLRVVLADGSEQIIPLPDFPRRYLTHDASVQMYNRWRIAHDLCRAGNWPVLVRRVRSALARRAARLYSRWRAGVSRHPRAEPVLVIDHDMGGGANHFRNERISYLRAQGRRVLLLLPHLASLGYELIELVADGERRRRFRDIDVCLAALPACAQVIVNSLVSFDDPERVLDWLQSLPRAVKITFYLHDFHPACPVWTLVNEHGRYCGIPELERCRQCLSGNAALFLAMLQAPDVGRWRRQWGRFLVRADTLVAFSRSSVDVLRKAFPELAMERVEVRPHDTTYIKPEPVAFDLGLPLTIGVVGHINQYKGAEIVAQMARIIEDEALPARIVVIGSIDNVPTSSALRVTGSYRSEQLPEILRREQVGVCLLPSIWHETFSYVTAELMAHDMPLAVFDLGAPAERVRSYAHGRIIPDVSARSALDTLFTFRDALLADSASSVSS